MRNVIYKPFIFDKKSDDFFNLTDDLSIENVLSIENDFSITPPRGYKSRYTQYEDEEDVIEDIIDPEIEKTEKSEKQTEIDFSLQDDINYRFPNKESFKTRMLQEYRSALEAHGIDSSYAKALVAQDALESAWGSKPSGLYNYGGIKGKGKTLTTTEYIDGKYINVNDNFRNFDSIQEYVNYKINLLNSPRYKAFSGDVKDFASRVSAGGYATAPNYASVLNSVIKSMHRGGILKFDKGGKAEANEYLDNNRTHYNNKIGEFSFLPPFNLPYNIAKYNINRINIVNSLPKEKRGSDVVATYENNSRTIYDTSNDSRVIRHEIGHALFNELEKNIESLIKKYGGDIYIDGVSKDEYYDSPREIIARIWTHLKDVDYKGNMSTRDTLRFIQDERDRLTTKYRADIRRADGSRTRSTHDSNGIKVHNSIGRGDIDFDNSKVYRTYNDRNHIIDRYKDSFILDLYQLIYEMKDNIQYARFGTKIKKFNSGGDIRQQVFDWASNKNGELKYAIKHGTPYATFYKLLRDPNRPVLDLGNGYTGTHKLSYVQNGDKWYIYPEIQWIQNMNGNWTGIDYSQEDDWKIGWENAYKNGDYLEIPTEEMAKYFTENYKKEFNNWYPGFEETKKSSYSDISLFEKFPFSDKTLQEWKKYSGWHPPMEHPDKTNVTFTPTIEDLAHQLTMAYETYQKMPYILETEKEDGTIQRQELIGHGLANKDLIEKYRKTGIPENVSSQLVIDELNRLNNLFIKMQPNYSKLPWNVRLAILDTAYNTKGENFWANSPKFTEMIQNGIIDPEILVSELDHSKNADSGWLRDRSAARRALALGKYRWNWQYVDKYGRHYNPNISLSSKDWTRGLYINKY